MRSRYGELQREIECRQHQLEEQVAGAIRGGRFWEMLRAEFARDYNSVLDGFLLYGVQVDRSYASDREHHGPASTQEGRGAAPSLEEQTVGVS